MCLPKKKIIVIGPCCAKMWFRSPTIWVQPPNREDRWAGNKTKACVRDKSGKPTGLTDQLAGRKDEDLERLARPQRVGEGERPKL
jgi:hypothetical protein